MIGPFHESGDAYRGTWTVVNSTGDGLRPIPAPDTPAPLLDLLNRCWDLDPMGRPSMETLQHELTALAGTLGPEDLPESSTSEGYGEQAPMECDAGVEDDRKQTDEPVCTSKFETPQFGPPPNEFPLKVILVP